MVRRRILTERRRLELKLEQYANYDMLTGLSNRRLFFENLERVLAESKCDGRRIALLYIDLDGFKEINDTYGHEAGDRVLIAVGNRLQQVSHADDLVARLGGDEFVVVLTSHQSIASVEGVARQIYDILQEPIPMGSLQYKVSASIGIALFPDSGEDAETLMRNADFAMYDIKKNGKGGIKIHAEHAG